MSVEGDKVDPVGKVNRFGINRWTYSFLVIFTSARMTHVASVNFKLDRTFEFKFSFNCYKSLASIKQDLYLTSCNILGLGVFKAITLDFQNQ